MNSRIILIRHSLTEGNEKGWYYGATDIPLTDNGIVRVKEYAKRGIYPLADLYFTTGMLRTKQTLAHINPLALETAVAIENLKEINFGKWECHTFNQLKNMDGFMDWAHDEEGRLKPPGGESKQEFKNRISHGINELLSMHANGMTLKYKEMAEKAGDNGTDISNLYEADNGNEMPFTSLVVCHGGSISMLLNILFPDEAGNIWKYIPEPAQGYVLELEDSKVVAHHPIMESNIDDL